MGAEDGVNFPRSSADLDQGLREMLRKSPRPFEIPGCDGDDGVLGEDLGWPSKEVGVRARDRSSTDL